MNDRMQRIEQALAALRPQHLEIRDDSHRHRGHAGAQDGCGHFAVEVVSEAFRGLPALARHRLVYATLGELMTTDIHALQISAKTQKEIQ